MARELLLTNATLFDGSGEAPQANASVLIRDERIAAVEAGPMPVPEGAEHRDLGGKCVLPGLIDTHVHTTLMGDEGLALFLAAGVTTARDVGGALDAVLAIRGRLARGEVMGPRLFVCGPLLDGPTLSFEHSELASLLQSVPDVDAVPGTVGALLDAGVDAVKLYFSLPPETARAIIGFVDKRVPVTGHLGWTRSLEAIEAGIDGLEHVWISPYNEFCALDMQYGAGASMMDPSFWTQTLKGWEGADLEAPLATKWFNAMVERQVHMGTTLDLLWTAHCGVESAMKDPDLKFQPPRCRARQRAMADQFGERPDWEVHGWFFEASAGSGALEKHQEVTRVLHERGGLVVGGTDCGAIPYPPPGFALLREVELLADSIGARAALQAVTSVAAQALRKQEDVGRVAPGCYADLLVVDGDPTRDVRDLRKLETTYRGGVAYDPAEILAAQPSV